MYEKLMPQRGETRQFILIQKKVRSLRKKSVGVIQGKSLRFTGETYPLNLQRVKQVKSSLQLMFVQHMILINQQCNLIIKSLQCEF